MKTELFASIEQLVKDAEMQSKDANRIGKFLYKDNEIITFFKKGSYRHSVYVLMNALVKANILEMKIDDYGEKHYICPNLDTFKLVATSIYAELKEE